MSQQSQQNPWRSNFILIYSNTKSTTITDSEMDNMFKWLQSVTEESEGEISDQRDDQDHKDSSGSVGEWGSLADVCLRNIFWFLEDQDRKSADLVCRHWHYVMHSPSLWRFRFFHFNGRLTKYRLSEYCSAVAYAKSLGSYLWTVEVCVTPPRKSLVARRMEQALSGLLSELTRVRAPLRSISIVRLEMDRSPWTSSLRNSLVSSLMDFLQRGASRLTSVCLNGMRNNMAHGLALLSALTYSSPRGSISSLDLRGFFSSSVRVHMNPQLPSILRQLKGLTNLSLSYSYLTDELLTALQHRPQGEDQHPSKDGSPLQKLSLQCSVSEYHQQLMFGSTWKALVSTCPELKVKLTVDQVINFNWLTRILLPEIPLTEFSMTAFYSSDSDWSARPLLQDLLPQYRYSLKHLSLDLSNCNETISEELLELVMKCEHLQELRVWAFMDIHTVQMLLNIRLTKRVSLNKIRVRILSMNDDTEELEEQLEQLTSSIQLPPELDFHALVHPFV